MHIPATRFLVLGLLASILVVPACSGHNWATSSAFLGDDAGGGGPTALSSGDDDGSTMAAEGAAPPISLPDAPSQSDVSADACGSGSCDDATVASACGDGIVQAGEQCDDGNAKPGDGCSGICQIEPGYTCPTPGQLCVYTVMQTCGNGIIEGQEACDDGNKTDGDGCSAACQVEPGWSCAVPGMPCTKMAMAVCGDGKVNSGEQCDDGNAIPRDGCSGVCKIEPGYACPTAGHPCVRIWVCGNGKIDPGEACDDGNTTSGDGCSSMCTVEPGYTCPNVGGSGGPCVKAKPNTCVDGILAGTEQCDDGNTTSGDGCSSTCKVEAGYTCPTPGAACKKIEFCGDGVVDLDIGDQCDDGNAISGDGCSSLCQVEPNYVCLTPGAPCISTAKCGDGKVQGSETCDDGNAVSTESTRLRTPSCCAAFFVRRTGWTRLRTNQRYSFPWPPTVLLTLRSAARFSGWRRENHQPLHSHDVVRAATSLPPPPAGRFLKTFVYSSKPRIEDKQMKR